MVDRDGPKEEPLADRLLRQQLELYRDAGSFIESGYFSTAIELITTGGELRDELVGSNTSEVWSVEASLQFNEMLHYLLNTLERAGKNSLAENIAANRLRTTSNPYEVTGLFYWAGVTAAQKGNFAVARTHAEESVLIAEDIGSPWLAAQSENLLSRICEDMGDEDAAKTILACALDHVEKGSGSALYLPEPYKQDVTYGVCHRLRFFLGQRLFYGREREVRHFCNETLTATPHPLRRGFHHHWMGQAEIMHTKPLVPGSPYRDVTQAAIHLKAAEEYFRQADEPVYAGFVVVDQGELGDMPRALERAQVYLDAARAQRDAIGSIGLNMEIQDLERCFYQAVTQVTASNN